MGHNDMLELTGFFSLRNQIERCSVTDSLTTNQRHNTSVAKTREQTNLTIIAALAEREMNNAQLMEVTGLSSSAVREATKRLIEQKRIRLVRSCSKGGSKSNVFGEYRFKSAE